MVGIGWIARVAGRLWLFAQSGGCVVARLARLGESFVYRRAHRCPPTPVPAATTGGAWAWSRRLPGEYQKLEAAVQRLASANDLGKQPLSFAVVSGTFTAQLAQQRGLCQKERCDMFSQLNPCRSYTNGWDELMCQSYAVGDIEAWAASSGTVMITRPAFRVYAPRRLQGPRLPR